MCVQGALREAESWEEKSDWIQSSNLEVCQRMISKIFFYKQAVNYSRIHQKWCGYLIALFNLCDYLLMKFTVEIVFSLLYFRMIDFFTFFWVNRRKYWFRKNFRLPFFDGFACFGMSWTQFDYFWKMSVCLSVCMWQKFCGKCSLRTNALNLMKFYI